jgi:hypothetical protein
MEDFLGGASSRLGRGYCIIVKKFMTKVDFFTTKVDIFE